jgi:hypothetical protein
VKSSPLSHTRHEGATGVTTAGQDIRWLAMGRIVSLLLSLTIVMTGCGDEEPEAPTGASGATGAAGSEPTGPTGREIADAIAPDFVQEQRRVYPISSNDFGCDPGRTKADGSTNFSCYVRHPDIPPAGIQNWVGGYRFDGARGYCWVLLEPASQVTLKGCSQAGFTPPGEASADDPSDNDEATTACPEFDYLTGTDAWSASNVSIEGADCDTAESIIKQFFDQGAVPGTTLEGGWECDAAGGPGAPASCEAPTGLAISFEFSIAVE